MRCYAVIDTNVLVSSLLTRQPESATARILDSVVDGSIVPLYCQEILDEYDDVLRREKSSFDTAIVDGVLKLIKTFGTCIAPRPTGATLPDLDDLVFYEIVMSKRKEDGAYLVTGNIRHFPSEPLIVTPSEMMAILDCASTND